MLWAPATALCCCALLLPSAAALCCFCLCCAAASRQPTHSTHLVNTAAAAAAGLVAALSVALQAGALHVVLIDDRLRQVTGAAAQCTNRASMIHTSNSNRLNWQLVLPDFLHTPGAWTLLKRSPRSHRSHPRV